jgi:hypothetical protein
MIVAMDEWDEATRAWAGKRIGDLECLRSTATLIEYMRNIDTAIGRLKNGQMLTESEAEEYSAADEAISKEISAEKNGWGPN